MTTWANGTKNSSSFSNGTKSSSSFANSSLNSATWVNPNRSDLTENLTGGEFYPGEFNSSEFLVATISYSYSTWTDGTQASSTWSNAPQS